MNNFPSDYPRLANFQFEVSREAVRTGVRDGALAN